MLAIGEKTDTGHTLRIITGPETDFCLDINGVATLDITKMLTAMNGTKKVILTLGRCRSESLASKLMEASNIPHLGALESEKPTPGTEKEPRRPGRAKPKDGEILPVVGSCSLCGIRNIEMFPGTTACASCMQIEVARKKG